MFLLYILEVIIKLFIYKENLYIIGINLQILWLHFFVLSKIGRPQHMFELFNKVQAYFEDFNIVLFFIH